MERRGDRELPSTPPPPLSPPPIQTNPPKDVESSFKWTHTLPIFFVLCAAASVAIFNYQKSSSPVVTSTLYALRTSKTAREYL